MATIERAWTDGAGTYSTTKVINGVAYEFRFDRAHVVASGTWQNSSFLQAMERTGLFVQNSFIDNGVYLISDYRPVGNRPVGRIGDSHRIPVLIALAGNVRAGAVVFFLARFWRDALWRQGQVPAPVY